MTFVATFLICLLISFVGMFFLGALIFESIIGMVVFFAFIAAVLITCLVNLSDRIDSLEKRLLEYEGDNKE